MKRAIDATLCVAVVLTLASLAVWRWWHGDQGSLPTQVVEHTTFVDFLEVRGELRPVVSRVITAPSSGADLLIVDLVTNGSPVKADDVVVQFDSTTQQRTLEQRRSELKQAESEVQKADAEGRRRVQAAEAELEQLRSVRDRAAEARQGQLRRRGNRTHYRVSHGESARGRADLVDGQLPRGRTHEPQSAGIQAR